MSGTRKPLTISRVVAQNQKVGKAFKKTMKKMVVKNVPPEKLKNYIEKYLQSTAKRSNLKGIAEVVAAWGATQLAVKVGNAYARAVEAPDSEVFGATEVVPLLHNENERLSRGNNHIVGGKVYTVNVDTGQTPTRSNRAMGRLYGLTNKNFFDTKRQAISDAQRSSMTLSCGFNQKTQAVFSTICTAYSINELNTIFDITDDFPNVTRQQVAYANIQRMRHEINIANINKYLPSIIKVYIIKYKQQATSYETLVSSCSNAALAAQDVMAMPRMNQLTVPVISSFQNSVQVDPLSNGILGSPRWKSQCEIVHTFKKKLNAGDKLNIIHDHYCGPGVRLDKLFGEARSAVNNLVNPSAYGLMFELVGVPVEGYRADNTAIRYLGTGLGFLSFEFRRSMLGSNIPQRDAAAEAAATIGGFNSAGFGVRIYTKEITTHLDVVNRIVNFSPSAIVSAPGTSAQLIIPIMADATPEDAGRLI